MSDFCPHCDARLPLAHDAFCPECRERLDDSVAVPTEDSPESQPSDLDAESYRRAALMMIVGFGLMIFGMMAWGTEASIEAMVKGGLGLCLFTAGMFCLIRDSRG